MNPLINMMSQSMGNNAGMGMFQQIRHFAGMIGNRDPEQMVRTLMQQRGISESQLQDMKRQAADIAKQMGIK